MSNIQVQLRRGTTAQHGLFTGAQGELTVDTDKNALVLHDGATVGGKVMPTGDVVAHLPRIDAIEQSTQLASVAYLEQYRRRCQTGPQ